jgi:hypothetical protein
MGRPKKALGTSASLVPISGGIRAHSQASMPPSDGYPCLRAQRFTRERSLVRNQPRPCQAYRVRASKAGPDLDALHGKRKLVLQVLAAASPPSAHPTAAQTTLTV